MGGCIGGLVLGSISVSLRREARETPHSALEEQ